MRFVVVLVGLAAGCGRLNFDPHDSPPTDGVTTGLVVSAPADNDEVGPAVRIKGTCIVANGDIEVHGTGVRGGTPTAACVGSAFDLTVDLTAGFGAKQLIVTQGAASVTRSVQRVPQRPDPFTAKSAFTVSAGPATNCDLVIANPPGISAGQLLVGMIYSDGGTAASISTPGFTRLTLASGVAVAFFKVVDFTEPAAYTFAIVAGNDNATCAAGGVLVGIRNVDPANPIDDDSANFALGISLVAPSVTTAFPTTILGVFGSNGPVSGIETPAGMDLDPDAVPNGSFARSPDGTGNALITWQAVDVGASGERMTTIGAARTNAGGLIALRPL